MRIGSNPAKKDKVEIDNTYHRIVIPVYIPNLNDFFKESLEVLKLCLESLYTTVHSNTRISIASNGCCKEVNDYLAVEFEANRIDELYQIKSGIGKINSLYKIINSVKEPLITISDADVLFTSGWQDAVEKIFIDYPKAGMVCPFSYSKGFRELTANIYFDNLFNKNIKVTEIKSPEGLEHFAKSIGNEGFYKDIHKKYGITYQEKGKSRALIGAGHFVATFKRAVFPAYEFKSNLQRLASGEGLYIDSPPVQSGLWRLSTNYNFVYHMGNTVTPMYLDIVSNNNNDTPKDMSNLPVVKKEAKFLFALKNNLFNRYFFSNKLFGWYLTRIGLTKNEVKQYLNL
ncbi:MAG: hypothetical protein COA88_05710 [Kordia sp.]|nr:MAG: hypothetical protein COA88_05710 [Kordia sp.]